MTASVSNSLSLAELRPLVGETFTLRGKSVGEVSVRLSEAASLGFNRAAADGGRESFSLLFHAAARQRVPQGTYDFSHPRLGTHAIFLVPLGPDERGMRLEVIFNFN